MATFLGLFLLPLLLGGSNSWRMYILLWCAIFYSLIGIVAEIIFKMIFSIEGSDWKVANTWWAKVIDFVRIQPLGSRSVIFSMVIQLSVGLISFVEVRGNSNDQGSCWSKISSFVDQIGKLITSYLHRVNQKCLSTYRSYGIYVEYCGFRLYRELFIFFELRCLLKWFCTTTSLTLHDWLQLEDIRSGLFLVKCDPVLNMSSDIKGQKKSKMTKLCNVIAILFTLTPAIWELMLTFFSFNPTYIPSKFGIWGVYISCIYPVGWCLKPYCSVLTRVVVPDVNISSDKLDRLNAICEDIYAARAKGELEVEEVLYWKLVKIYLSPRRPLEP